MFSFACLFLVYISSSPFSQSQTSLFLLAHSSYISPVLGHTTIQSVIAEPFTKMPPFNHNVFNLPASSSSLSSRSTFSLQRRWSTCSTYDTSCSTHRTALLAIVLAVCFLTTLVLFLLIMRHYRRRATRTRIIETQQAKTGRQMRYSYRVTPPTYHGDNNGAVGSGGLEIPPPAYTKESREGRVVR
jgi:hypothetical protein